MDTGIIAIIAFAFLGPVLVFLTRYVLKGRTAAASRLWFLSFCTYVVYYYLAQSYFDTGSSILFYLALLWPIPAILAFWFAERTSTRQSPIFAYRWMVYFLAGVVFAFLLDTVGASAGWFTYSPSVITSATSVTNPISGAQAPAIVWFMLGILMAVVFFLADNVYEALKRRIGAMTTNYVLIALALLIGGILWAASDVVLNAMK